jgi:hypothetical protein
MPRSRVAVTVAVVMAVMVVREGLGMRSLSCEVK